MRRAEDEQFHVGAVETDGLIARQAEPHLARCARLDLGERVLCRRAAGRAEKSDEFLDLSGARSLAGHAHRPDPKPQAGQGLTALASQRVRQCVVWILRPGHPHVANL